MKFGDRIKISNKLIRLCKYEGTDYNATEYKFWYRLPLKEVEVIFLGTRTLTNGIRRYDSEEGWSYSPKEKIKAMLVCMNERTSPFYAIEEIP